jgi:FMN phosphatase YigB (HAD superfamily)
MLRAVLFDLDNTLIRYSERQFFDRYLPKVTEAFSDMMPPGIFVEKLILSTQALMNNDGSKSNAEYFMSLFCSGYEGREEEIWSRFIEFYRTQFDEFRALVTVPHGVRELFLRLKSKGIKTVIASNPIWPLYVQIKRLSWAGIDDLDFDLITHLENMSYCKPHIEYYEQTCQKIGETPGECLMVGNDPVNDMVVATVGMKTFLVTDHGEIDNSSIELSRKILTYHATAEVLTPDFRGPLSRVPDAVEDLLKDSKIN